MEEGRRRNYKIGNFTEEVKFLRPVAKETETGAVVFDYVLHECRLCEMQDTVLDASFIDDAITYTKSYSAVTWNVEGVTSEWRAEYKGERYSIDRILNVGRDITRYELKNIDICNQ